MPVPSNVLLQLVDQILAIAAAITDGGQPVFGARVFDQGQDPNLTVVPAAVLTLEEEQVLDPRQTTNKTRIVLRWTLEVVFDSASVPAAANLRERHTHLLRLVKDAYAANPSLSGKAIDTHYVGRGSALRSRDVEQEPDQWFFPARFETEYRHRRDDSSVAA